MTEQQPPAGEPQPLPVNPFESINFVSEIFNLWFDLKVMAVLFDETVKHCMCVDGSPLSSKMNNQSTAAARKIALEMVQNKFPQIPLQFTEKAKINHPIPEEEKPVEENDVA